MNYEIIPKGTILYRFISLPPKEVSFGLKQNNGKEGRFNWYHNVYYCCKNLESLHLEIFDKKCGTLIRSVVTEDIKVFTTENDVCNFLLSGPRPNDIVRPFHKYVFFPVFGNIIVDDEIPNAIFNCITYKYPDGLAYNSINSPNVIIDDCIFLTSEKTLFGNLALTETGFSKIQELDKIVFWF